MFFYIVVINGILFVKWQGKKPFKINE